MIAHAIARHILLAELRSSARVWLRSSRSDRVHPARAGKLRADAWLALEQAQRIEDGEPLSEELIDAVLASEAEAERDARADVAAWAADRGL